jgi:hypothetical protein
VAESDPAPAGDHEEQSRSVPLWLVALAVLALGGIIEVIIYGYLEKPGWIGVANKRFWDYLELLIVPAALALGEQCEPPWTVTPQGLPTTPGTPPAPVSLVDQAVLLPLQYDGAPLH